MGVLCVGIWKTRECGCLEKSIASSASLPTCRLKRQKNMDLDDLDVISAGDFMCFVVQDASSNGDVKDNTSNTHEEPIPQINRTAS